MDTNDGTVSVYSSCDQHERVERVFMKTKEEETVLGHLVTRPV